MSRKSTKPKRNPFDPDYAPYGRNQGELGNPTQWKRAYEERFTAEEAAEILTGQKHTAWEILGVSVKATWTEIKSAYRKIVIAECQAAFALHPDPVVEKRYKEVKAAYSKLADDFGEKG
jgi:DnaJ-class molecular chaperone